MDNVRKNRFFLFFLLFSAFAVTLCAETLKVEFPNLAKVLPWNEEPGTFSSGGLRILGRGENCRPGERWLEYVVKLDAEGWVSEGNLLAVSVEGGKPEKIVAKREVPVSSSEALVRIDVRSMDMQRVRIRAELKDNKGQVAEIAETPWVKVQPARLLAEGVRIPVKLDIPEGGGSLDNYPVRFGIPFPEGAVWGTDGLKVVDIQGNEFPSQFEAAGRWAPEGSVKWMWADALVSGTEDFFVEAGRRTSGSNPASPVSVKETPGGFVVATGVAQYVVAAGGALVKEASFNGQVAAREGLLRGLYVIDQKGRTASASGQDADMKLESAGPVSAVVRIEGFYRTKQGESLASHITRLKFTAGRKEVEAIHTLVLIHDTNEVWFKEVGWEFELPAGGGKQAFFSLSPKNPQEVLALPVEEGRIFSMVQREGVSLGITPRDIDAWNSPSPKTGWSSCFHGSYKFVISEKGIEKPLYEGKDMGDWTALSGKDSGWMVSCRDAAAQHPKEFEAGNNRLNLKLFTPSSGKELDFRMESIMQNWGVLPVEKVPSGGEVPRHLLENYLDFIVRHSSNAIGWSKTHQILLSPFDVSAGPAVASLLHSKQVFAHVSPMWIRSTEAMLGLHPKDKERFPEAEAVIEGLFKRLVERLNVGAKGGFIDYNAGPGQVIWTWRSGSYSFRSKCWYLYVRSADRTIREIAQGSNRAYLDGNVSHWSSPGKTRGLFVGDNYCFHDRPDIRGSIKQRNRKCDLPLYWEGVERYEHDTPVNLDQALLDYYITGYRRAGDIVRNYGQAAKENLTAEYRDMPWRPKLAVRHVAQAYEMTWEPRLRELIYEIMINKIYDPEGEFLFSRRLLAHKMGTDGDVPLALWKLLGDRLFYRMAMEVARWNWEESASILPPVVGQNRATGFLGHFLWEETGCPSMVAGFDYARRRLVADLLDHERQTVRLTCVSQLPRFFKGLPFAMDVLTRAEAEEKPAVSWIAFKVQAAPASLFFIKPGSVSGRMTESDTAMELFIRKEWSPPGDAPIKPLGCSVILQPHTKQTHVNAHDFHTITEKNFGSIKVRIPKNAYGGVYEVIVKDPGVYSVFSDRHTPLSLHAPGGWMPPRLNPPVRTFFRVPEGVDNGKIFFGKKTSLFQPGGKAYREGMQLSGWVELPGDQPGLWSFESIDAGEVKTENLPAFFAINDPGFYLEYEK